MVVASRARGMERKKKRRRRRRLGGRSRKYKFEGGWANWWNWWSW
jgi:hypothetical protein